MHPFSANEKLDMYVRYVCIQFFINNNLYEAPIRTITFFNKQTYTG